MLSAICGDGELEDGPAVLLEEVLRAVDRLRGSPDGGSRRRASADRRGRSHRRVVEVEQPEPGSAGSRRTAPAPSPKSTAVVRSSGSMMALMRSAPTTITRGGPRRHDLGAGREGVEEPGAGRRQVEPPRLPEPDLVLDEAGGGGEHHVGRDGRDDQRVDVVRARARAAVMSRRTASAPMVEVVSPGRADPALADPGAGHDPVVGGIQPRRELGVGDDAARGRRSRHAVMAARGATGGSADGMPESRPDPNRAQERAVARRVIFPRMPPLIDAGDRHRHRSAACPSARGIRSSSSR